MTGPSGSHSSKTLSFSTTALVKKRRQVLKMGRDKIEGIEPAKKLSKRQSCGPKKRDKTHTHRYKFRSSVHSLQQPNERATEMAAEVTCCGTKFWLYVLIIIGLVCFAGMMAGLTLGLMSLGLVDLEVLMKSGRPQDRKHAAKIYPVVKNQHLLLCTLLIGNALAMEALPIFLDSLVPPLAAIVISVTLILVFGEILPQAVCTRYGLTVGATMAPFVRVLLILFLPISYPISKVLDWMLGKGHAALLRRAELKTFVDFHCNEAGKGGDLTHDETTIIAGALELTEKTAKDAMTLISSAFSLDLDAPLTLETLNAIMTKGHSRVPVYAGNPKNIIGLVLVKNLLMIDPEDAVTLRKMMIRRIPRVSEDIPLYDILNEFQKGHSHIAVVYKDLNGRREALKNGKEGETSVFKDDCKMQGGQSEASLKNDGKVGLNNAQIAMDNGDGGQQNKKSPPATPAFKKRHRGCSHCILDIENTPIPVFPDNEEVVGVITMEDVIEELLQEEILDETDEYVNIHNRIKVNMHASQEKDFHLNSPQLSPEGSSATPTITSSVPTDLGSTQHQDSAKVATIGPVPTSSHTPTHQGSEGDMLRDR